MHESAPDDNPQVRPPGLAVTVYAVIAAPPLLTGASHDTTTCPLPFEASILVGASGSVAGVTVLVAGDELEVPTVLVAVTVNVYAVPLVRPLIVQESAPDDNPQVRPPGLVVTVYAVIVDPPLLTGALHDTTTCVLPLTPATLVGAPGSVIGVTTLEAGDELDVPAALVAVTVNV